MALAFTKDQIKVVLQEFVSFLQTDETMLALKRLAPSEDKISNYIEESQRKIFVRHGVNPDKGMSDLSKIASVWKAEEEIVQLLMFLASKEELVVQEALGENVDPEGTKFRPQMIQLSFVEMKAQLENIKTDKDALMQFQLAMQKQVNNLPPEQREEYMAELNKSLSKEQKDALQSIQMEQIQQMQQIMQQQYKINAPKPIGVQADKSGKQEEKPQSSTMQAPKPQTISPSNPNANTTPSSNSSTSTSTAPTSTAPTSTGNSELDALQQQMQMLLQMQQTQIQQPQQF